MGMFDTFVSKDGLLEVQLKNGPCLLNNYEEGGSVDGDYADAVYYAPEGVVVVRNGVVESVTHLDVQLKADDPLPRLTKWGDAYSPETFKDLNPFTRVVAELRAMNAEKNRGSDG